MNELIYYSLVIFEKVLQKNENQTTSNKFLFFNFFNLKNKNKDLFDF